MKSLDFNVELGDRSYPVFVRADARPELTELCLGLAPTGKAIVISDQHVASLYAQSFVEDLRARGLNTALLTFPAGEGHKTMDTVRNLYERCLQFGVDRKTPIIAYGGGVVGDVAGFVAATLLRGLPFVQAPTTVLAQVDSSIGGKVGVNLPHGKNLVGAFYQPKWVFMDAVHLSTQSRAERRSGLAELVKHAVLSDAELLTELKNDARPLLDGDAQKLRQVIGRGARIKADVVAQDETEAGKRAILNLGHTMGHAYETAAGYGKLKHGDAVALGLRFAVALSVLDSGLSRAEAQLINETLDAFGLPSDWAARTTKEVVQRVGFDKKNRGDQVNTIQLRSLESPVIVPMSMEIFANKALTLAQKAEEKS